MADRNGVFSGRISGVLLFRSPWPPPLHSAATAASTAVPNLSPCGKENCFSVWLEALDLSPFFSQILSNWVSFKPALQSTLQIDTADGKIIFKTASPFYRRPNSLTWNCRWNVSCHGQKEKKRNYSCAQRKMSQCIGYKINFMNPICSQMAVFGVPRGRHF